MSGIPHWAFRIMLVTVSFHPLAKRKRSEGAQNIPDEIAGIPYGVSLDHPGLERTNDRADDALNQRIERIDRFHF